MPIIDCFCHPTPDFLRKSDNAFVANPTVLSKLQIYAANKVNIASTKPSFTCSYQNSKALAVFMGAAGITLISLVGPSHAAESPIFSEPSNALSIPTWTTHISSVVEWVTAMALVWQYGEKSGYESWKGLSWGMVPLLGGALCACTWHFFYNSESLEVLVAIQAALTVLGNLTMCIAAYRIYISSQERSKDF